MSEKVLAATGIEALDEELEKILPEHGMALVNTCYHKAVLERVVEITGADTVIISPDLPGEGDIIEIAYRLRVNKGKRIVVLAGDMRLEETRKLIARLASMHIYDFLYNTGSKKVKAKDVVNKLLAPGDVSDIPAEVRDAVEIGGGRVYADINEKIEKVVVEASAGDKDKSPGFFKNVFTRNVLSRFEKKEHASRNEETEKEITAKPPVKPIAGSTTRLTIDLQDHKNAETANELPTKETFDEKKPSVGLITSPIKISNNRRIPGQKKIQSDSVSQNKTPAFIVPPDFVAIGDRCCSNIAEVVDTSPTAVLVAASFEAGSIVKNLRRESSLSHVPIVVVGQTDEAACYAVGADECVVTLDEDTVARIRAKANRMREIREEAGTDRQQEAGWQPLAETQLDEVALPDGDDIYRDALTGCYTRRFLLERFALNRPCAVAFIDLDNFKPVNDILGHEAGDRVLTAFGKMLTENLKGQDVAIRWGGDEFVLILPETNIKAAEKVVENLRAAWEKAAPDTGNLIVGFSAGMSAGKDGLGEAIKAADKAMYERKNQKKSGHRDVTQPTFQLADQSVPAQKEPWWNAARQGMTIFFVILETIIILSAGTWLTNQAFLLFGKSPPWMEKLNEIVVWFWKAVYTGITGRIV